MKPPPKINLEKPTVKSESPKGETLSPILPKLLLSESSKSSFKDCSHEETLSPIPDLNSKPILISDSPVNDTGVWISHLDLSLQDKAILQSSQWLNDGIIFAAQNMLSAQTKGKINGWQSTQCSKREDLFSVVPSSSPFIQLLHVGSCHWITVSNVNVHDSHCGCFCDIIGVYDSLRPTIVHSDIKKSTSVCSFFKCSSDTLRFDIMNVSAQSNSYDCGVHAIANATELAYKADPVVCDWNNENNVMRQHLLNCFESGVLTRFPRIGERKIRYGTRVCKSVTVSVYCKCRLMNDELKVMIECMQCRKWYHNECVGLDSRKSYSGVKWVCADCKQLVDSMK